MGLVRFHRVFFILFFNFLLSPAAYAVFQSSTEAADSSYSDCADLTFQNIDNADKTKAEELAALEQDLFAVLNQSEECMSEASANSAGRIGDAGAGGGSGDNGNGSAKQTAQANQSKPTSKATTENAKTSAVTGGERGKGNNTGSTQVCETVNQALSSASTDSEKAHFEKLLEQYNCK